MRCLSSLILLCAACTPAQPAAAPPGAATPAATPAAAGATATSPPSSGDTPGEHAHGHSVHQDSAHPDSAHHPAHAEPGHAQHGPDGYHKDFSDAAGFSAHFDDPARDAWQRPAEVIEHLRIPPGSIVADLGAGTGYF